jgi:hypothetical protein
MINKINQLRNILRTEVKSKVHHQIYSELDVQVFAQLHWRVYLIDLASQIKNNLSNQINSNIKL